jgi:aerobic carbon-monoxide dehydrogenase medium subunit
VSAPAAPRWLAPTSLEEALALRGDYGDDATVLAGGTFLGILLNQGLLRPARYLWLGRIAELSGIQLRDGSLWLGAMTTHSAVERSAEVKSGWPALAQGFGLVASPRVRAQATVGGVLADADYASDPPAIFAALGARAVLRSAVREREVSIEELIVGYYETCIEPDELLVGVNVPSPPERMVYRKFCSRSHEDRPCVSVAAIRADASVSVVVGAVAEVPQRFPDVCALAEGRPLSDELCRMIADGYADRLEPLSDVRGSAEYRRRVAAVEVRRALEKLAG